MKGLFFCVVLSLTLSGFASAGEPPPKTPAFIQKGQALFATNCIVCHGPKGDGMGDAGKYMSPKPRSFVTDKFKNGEKVSDVFKSVTVGLDGTAMAGFKDLPEVDRWALSYYVLTFKDKK